MDEVSSAVWHACKLCFLEEGSGRRLDGTMMEIPESISDAGVEFPGGFLKLIWK